MNRHFHRLFPAGFGLVVALGLLHGLAGAVHAYTCAMDGPMVMGVNTRATFSVPLDNTVIEVNWTITGHGRIASNPHATAVIVESSTPGPLELVAHVMLNSGGGVVDCRRTVDVRELDCTISGDTEAVERGPWRSHRITPPAPGVTIQWQVSGYGVIRGAADSYQVLVAPVAVGHYVISVTLTSGTLPPSTCSVTVPVAFNPSVPHPNQRAKLLIHLGTNTTKNACGQNPPRCEKVITQGKLFPRTYFAYLLVADGSASYGVGGAQFGINYTAQPGAGVDVFGWSLCATLEFPSTGPNGPWPAAGSGNLITWDVTQRCQRYEPSGSGTGVVATVGYFYVGAYSPDPLRITPRPVDGLAKVAACDGTEDVIAGPGNRSSQAYQLGYAYFSPEGDWSGYNPCDLVAPVVPTTWSAIKGQYAR